MAMANLCKLERGRPTLKAVEVVEAEQENGQICPINRDDAAEKAGVAPRTLASAMKVDRHGAPELVEAVKAGKVSVSAAAKVVDAVPDHEQQVKALQAAQEQPRKIEKSKMVDQRCAAECPLTGHFQRRREGGLRPHLAGNQVAKP